MDVGGCEEGGEEGVWRIQVGRCWWGVFLAR